MNRLNIIAAALAITAPITATAAQFIAIHRDPGCGCCEEWARRVKSAFGGQVRMIDDANRTALKKRLGVPDSLASCHTAVINGMAFEGHVPIADMKRALAQRPKGVNGLAVAGMPLGSPGMEAPGRPAQPFSVVTFGPGVRKVFARH